MNETDYPLVTIIIATYNSAWILNKSLNAIKKQTYPQDKIEILIIDGGSTDSTKLIAQTYGCRILDNPDTDPVSAKFLGIRNARGMFLMTLDHDEVLLNSRSIELRICALLKHPECKVALLSGYKCPEGYCGLNEYISEFGDPFSMFYYRFSAGYSYCRECLVKRCSLVRDFNDYAIFDVKKGFEKVIVELICLGSILNLYYFKGVLFADSRKDDITHMFYNMIKHGETYIIQSKDDPLIHYSSDTLQKYLPKLKWRIINNVHYYNRANQGFTGRNVAVGGFVLRKYLFPLYSITLLLPTFDGVYLAITRKNICFLMHPYLCLYVTIYIVYQYIRKFFGWRPQLKTYDGGKNL